MPKSTRVPSIHVFYCIFVLHEEFDGRPGVFAQAKVILSYELVSFLFKWRKVWPVRLSFTILLSFFHARTLFSLPLHYAWFLLHVPCSFMLHVKLSFPSGNRPEKILDTSKMKQFKLKDLDLRYALNFLFSFWETF